jgi:hypothetical protein
MRFRKRGQGQDDIGMTRRQGDNTSGATDGDVRNMFSRCNARAFLLVNYITVVRKLQSDMQRNHSIYVQQSDVQRNHSITAITNLNTTEIRHRTTRSLAFLSNKAPPFCAEIMDNGRRWAITISTICYHGHNTSVRSSADTKKTRQMGKLLDICPRANWIGSTNGLDGFDPLGY